METGQKRLVTCDSPKRAYSEAMEYLKKVSNDSSIIDQLSVGQASDGNKFEVVKFLVGLINEMRITHEQLLYDNYGLSSHIFEHLNAIFLHIDDQPNWDPIDSWPSILSQGLQAEPSVQDGTPSTPKTLSRVRPSGFTTTRRYHHHSLTRQSPLAESLSSPRIRDARILRQKEREIKNYRERINCLECEKDDLEGRVSSLNAEILKLSKRADDMASVTERLRKESHLAKVESEEWKQKAFMNAEAVKESKRKIDDLMEMKLIQETVLRRSDYELSEKNGQLESERTQNQALMKKLTDSNQQNERLYQDLQNKTDSINEMKRLLEIRNNEIDELKMTLEGLRERIHDEKQAYDFQLSLQVDRCQDLATELSLQERKLEEQQTKQELDMQMKQVLEEREKQCEEIRKLRMKLSDVERQLFSSQSELKFERTKLSQVSTENQSITESLTELQESFKQVVTEKMNLMASSETTQRELEECEKEMSKLRERFECQKNELNSLHKDSISRMKQWSAEKAEYQRQIDTLKDALQKLERHSEEAKEFAAKEKADLEIRLSSVVKEREDVKVQLASQKESSKKREEELLSELAEKVSLVNELEMESNDKCAEAQRQLTALVGRNEELEKKVNDYNTTIKELRQKFVHDRELAECEQKKMNAQMKTLSEQINRLEDAKVSQSEIAAHKDALLKSELDQIRREHNSLWEEATELKQMHANLSEELVRRASYEEQREFGYKRQIEQLKNDRKQKDAIISEQIRMMATMRQKYEMRASRYEEKLSGIEAINESVLRERDEQKANAVCFKSNMEHLSQLLAEERETNKKMQKQLDDFAFEKEDLKRRYQEATEKADQQHREYQNLKEKQNELETNLQLEAKRYAVLQEEVVQSRKAPPLCHESGVIRLNTADEESSMVSGTIGRTTYGLSFPGILSTTLIEHPSADKSITFSQSMLNSHNATASSSNSIDSDRIRELQRRNTLAPYHMRSYPHEVSSLFSERDLHEDDFRNNQNFSPSTNVTKNRRSAFSKLGGRMVAKVLSSSVVRESPKLGNALRRRIRRPFASLNE
ncbi:unnamed protein product [Anisakis simplex]|uniref:Uncharacterized protein n=1 Tax=Anisakis simplex TaxID=6269 RepID=A0A3P6N7J1_ANISI|nr:unnamed protein product [Anisakis simplex]